MADFIRSVSQVVTDELGEYGFSLAHAESEPLFDTAVFSNNVVQLEISRDVRDGAIGVSVTPCNEDTESLDAWAILTVRSPGTRIKDDRVYGQAQVEAVAEYLTALRQCAADLLYGSKIAFEEIARARDEMLDSIPDSELFPDV